MQSELHIGRPFTGNGNFSLITVLQCLMTVLVSHLDEGNIAAAEGRCRYESTGRATDGVPTQSTMHDG